MRRSARSPGTKPATHVVTAEPRADGAIRMIDKRGGLAFRFTPAEPHPLSDLYLDLLRMRWRRWIGVMFVGYFGLNAVFAAAFVLGGDCIRGARPGHFGDAFFFSVETMSTIGFGEMTPSTTYAQVLCSLEAFAGVLVTAVVTGLAFAKFSRPTARVEFSERAVITRREGVPYFSFRVANQRNSSVVEPTLRVTLMREEPTREGGTFRRFVDVPLERSWNPVFAVAWTALHRIDERSPFHGCAREDLEASRTEVVATFVGLDETLNDTIHARSSYLPSEIDWDARFVNLLHDLPDGRRTIDLSRFHETVPLEDE